MTKWSEIIALPGWDDLSLEAQQEVHRRWMQKEVAPAIANHPNRDELWQEIASRFHTGQGMAESLANAAGRGPLKAVPKLVELVGDGLGIASLSQAGRQGIRNVERELPVNPANAGSWPVLLAPWFLPLLFLGVILKRKVSSSGEDTAQPTAPPELRGVKGWLKFWCVMTTFLGPLQIIGRAGTFAPIHAAANQEGEHAMASLIWLHLVVALGFAGGVCWMAVRIWKVRAGALVWVRRFWWVLVIWQVTFMTFFFMLNPRPGEWRIDVMGTLASSGAMVVWCLYFIRSKRVAATFGPWSWAAYRHEPWPRPTDSNCPSAEEKITPPWVGSTVQPASIDSTSWAPPSPLPPPDVSTAEPVTKPGPGDGLEGYEKLAEEKREGFVHEVLWLKCISECDGDEARAKAAYNRWRAAMLAREV